MIDPWNSEPSVLRTQTGIPTPPCDECGMNHVRGKSHCTVCGAPSRFMRDGQCLHHTMPQPDNRTNKEDT